MVYKKIRRKLSTLGSIQPFEVRHNNFMGIYVKHFIKAYVWIQRLILELTDLKIHFLLFVYTHSPNPVWIRLDALNQCKTNDISLSHSSRFFFVFFSLLLFFFSFTFCAAHSQHKWQLHSMQHSILCIKMTFNYEM